MPNWCLNCLEIQGSDKQVKEVLDYIAGDKSDKDSTLFDFNKIIPMPKELIDLTSPTPEKEKALQEKMKKKYGYANWYDWCIGEWGTKWNSSDVEILYVADSMTDTQIYFSTAWAPPVPVIVALGNKFPKLHFILEYFEGGMCFAGRLDVEGKHVSEEEYDSDSGTYKNMAVDFGMVDETEEEVQNAT